MKSFPEKVKEQRGQLGISQKELAERAAIGIRTITAYERGECFPQAAQLYKLARALDVSTEYLKDDRILDPTFGLERMDMVEEARHVLGTTDALSVEELLRQNRALFAGGTLSESAKDDYFQALLMAYSDCKREAKTKYGKAPDHKG